jgi:hypothetical protein
MKSDAEITAEKLARWRRRLNRQEVRRHALFDAPHLLAAIARRARVGCGWALACVKTWLP